MTAPQKKREGVSIIEEEISLLLMVFNIRLESRAAKFVASFKNLSSRKVGRDSFQ